MTDTEFAIKQAMKQHRKKATRLRHTDANFRKYWWGHQTRKKNAKA